MSVEQKKKNTERVKLKWEAACSKVPDFPPPPSKQLQETIALNWSKDMSSDEFMEDGCTVCGQLVRLSQLSGLYDSGCDLDILDREGMGVTHLERSSPRDPIQEIKGPVLD